MLDERPQPNWRGRRIGPAVLCLLIVQRACELQQRTVGILGPLECHAELESCR